MSSLDERSIPATRATDHAWPVHCTNSRANGRGVTRASVTAAPNDATSPTRRAPTPASDLPPAAREAPTGQLARLRERAVRSVAPIPHQEVCQP